MKHSVTLSGASALSILLLTLHFADDIARARDEVNAAGLLATVLVVVAWLYETLVLTERRTGYVIMLLGSILGLAIPVTHVMGAGGIAGGGGVSPGRTFFHVWTLLALGLTTILSIVLSARGLWSLRRERVSS